MITLLLKNDKKEISLLFIPTKDANKSKSINIASFLWSTYTSITIICFHFFIFYLKSLARSQVTEKAKK